MTAATWPHLSCGLQPLDNRLELPVISDVTDYTMCFDSREGVGRCGTRPSLRSIVCPVMA